MDKWRGKVAIVTGASSGIGAAIAASLVREGVVVVGLARRDDKIKSLATDLSDGGAPGKLYSLKGDMRKEEDIVAAFTWVERELGGPHILVNNAGVYNTTYIAEGNTEVWRNILEVNVLGLAICCKEFLKSMEKRNNNTGHIINISSVLGHVTDSQMAVYSASKHAVKAFSMCLRKEILEKGSSIKVTTVCPGPVATPIFDGTVLSEITKKTPIMASEDVAKVVIETLSTSSVTQICEVVMTPIPTSVLPY